MYNVRILVKKKICANNNYLWLHNYTLVELFSIDGFGGRPQQPAN